VLAQDIWPGLLDYFAEKAKKEHVGNLQTVLGKGDDPNLSRNHIELIDTFDIFQGENNPGGTEMPEHWFVVYSRRPSHD